MILYLMRHGEAVPADKWSGSEKDRPLAPRGEKELEATVPEWTRLHFSPKTLLSSPFKRAQQTAEYVSRATSIPVTLTQLGAGAKPDDFRSVFLEPQWAWPLLYVGHMPDLAFLSSRITHLAELLETTVKTGEMLAFETGEWKTAWGTGQLLWRRDLAAWKKLKEI